MSGQNAPGGGITYSDLIELAGNSKTLGDSVESWNSFVQGVEVKAQDLDDQVNTPLKGYWYGEASDLAQNAVTQDNAHLQGEAATLHKIAGVLETIYSNLVQVGINLENLEDNPYAFLPVNTPLAAPMPPGSPPAPPNPSLWGTESWPLPDAFRGAFTIAPGTGGIKGGTVLVQPDAPELLKSGFNITQNEIDWWKDAYQYEVTWYINKANELDQAAAEELKQLGPKPAPKAKTPPEPSTTIGGTTVTVASWPDQTSTLWGIAEKVYGNGNYWPYIYDHNKGRQDFPENWDPNDIQEGWDIDVPKIAKNAPIPPVPAAATPGGQG
jgi:hypothetical protein